MTTIHDLTSIGSMSASDELPIYSPNSGGTRKATIAALAVRLNELIQGEPDQTIYNMTASGSSFTTTLLPATAGASVWAQLTLSAPAPNGTINLPDINNRANGQEVLVTCTQPVAVLTLIGLGASVVGAPTSLTANGYFRLRYDLVSNCWYRVG